MFCNIITGSVWPRIVWVSAVPWPVPPKLSADLPRLRIHSAVPYSAGVIPLSEPCGYTLAARQGAYL